MSICLPKQVGFIGFDQYGNTFRIAKYPRKELLEQLGATRADKMYVDTKSGQAKHTGYIIKGHWVSVYRICELHNIDEPATEKPKKEITISWHIEDVQSIRPDLNDEQAFEVLEDVKNNHDASLGICYLTLEIYAEQLFPEPDSAN